MAVDESTIFVHFDGHMFVWVLKQVLGRAPNLKTISVIPSQLNRVGEQHRKLCEQHAVHIVTGRWRPELAWAKGENRSHFYQGQREFLTSLSGEQKDLFDELLLFQFEEAQIVTRYFCLNGDEYIPEYKVADLFGFGKNTQAVSDRINTVLKYLDVSFEVGKAASRRARYLQLRVLRLRLKIGLNLEAVALSECLTEKAKELGIPRLPAGLPISLLETFENLIRIGKKSGQLDDLKAMHPRWYEVIATRFGLEDSRFKSLEETGKIVGSISKERTRQIEERGFEFLGLEPDS
ncbi:MAG: hypothetical protein A2666_05190 [Parcubacteria group bacterium RIFCSPHIGHO2_01_FULL_47_10b]|nr:MAG: hypothetical protein A2666_05190 [Parcubacteria group bacterium RIFCSPHIGHO2_01_FULL_47_10b]